MNKLPKFFPFYKKVNHKTKMVPKLINFVIQGIIWVEQKLIRGILKNLMTFSFKVHKIKQIIK